MGNTPLDVVVNPETNKVYVANSSSLDRKFPGTVSVIDGSTYKMVDNITEGIRNPATLAINPKTNKVYVADQFFNTVSVIDGSTNEVVYNITQGISEPTEIAVDSETDTVYVANQVSNAISVIDPYIFRVLNITVGKLSYDIDDIAVDSKTNRVYVANRYSNTVSVIDGSINKVVDNITEAEGIIRPSAIAIDSKANKVYVAGERSDTVSMIDGSTNTVVAAITFSINPSDSGHIKCNNENIATNQYIKIGFDTKCTAIPNRGFEFSNWVENFGKDSTRTISAAAKSDFWYTPIMDWFESFADTLGFKTVNYDSATFNVTRYGYFTAILKGCLHHFHQNIGQQYLVLLVL